MLDEFTMSADEEEPEHFWYICILQSAFVDQTRPYRKAYVQHEITNA